MNNDCTKHPRGKKAGGEAARWHNAFTRTERDLKALLLKFPSLGIHDRCDFACPGVAIFNGSEIQRCDECKRFPSDNEAIDFVRLTLQAQALGVEVKS